jgi:hypothetical protein
MFGIVHSHIFLDFILQGIQYKITKSIKRKDFIVSEGSYLQDITTCCSEKTSVKFIKEGMIKLREASLLHERIQYTLAGSSVYHSISLSSCVLTSIILRSSYTKNCVDQSTAGLFISLFNV